MSALQVEHEVPSRKSPAERWAEIRRRGMLSFVIRRGILFPGLLFATFRFLDDYFGVLTGSSWRGWRYELLSFAFAAIFFGSIMGFWGWRYMKRQFETRAHESKSDRSANKV
jgi:hypothetical protein